MSAGDTTGEFSSLSSPSWEAHVGPRTFPTRMSEAPLKTTLFDPFEVDVQVALAGVRIREAALGTLMLFLLEKRVWVSGRVVVVEWLVLELRDADRLLVTTNGPCLLFVLWLVVLVRSVLLTEVLVPTLLFESYKGTLECELLRVPRY